MSYECLTLQQKDISLPENKVVKDNAKFSSDRNWKTNKDILVLQFLYDE